MFGRVFGARLGFSKRISSSPTINRFASAKTYAASEITSNGPGPALPAFGPGTIHRSGHRWSARYTTDRGPVVCVRPECVQLLFGSVKMSGGGGKGVIRRFRSAAIGRHNNDSFSLFAVCGGNEAGPVVVF